MAEKTKTETLARFSKHDEIFHLVKDKNGKVNILVGNYKVSSKTFDTFEQADNYIGSKPYELIFTTCNVMTNTIMQNEKEKQNKMAKEPTKETKTNI